MKKLFVLFAVAGLMFTASCGNKEVETESTEEVEMEMTEPEIIEEPAPIDSIGDTTAVEEVIETPAQ